MTDIEAIRLAKTVYRDGYNRGNIDGILSVFGEGFSDMSDGNASFYGPEAPAVLRHRLRKLFAKYRAHLAVTIISIGIEGKLAFDWGWHALTLNRKKGGKSRTFRTRYLEIWQKNQQGQWKIAIFFDNADVPPQMPPREVIRALKQPSVGRSRRLAGRSKRR